MEEVNKKKLSAAVDDTDKPSIKKRKKGSFAEGIKKAFGKKDSEKSKLEVGVRDFAKALMSRSKEK